MRSEGEACVRGRREWRVCPGRFLLSIAAFGTPLLCFRITDVTSRQKMRKGAITLAISGCMSRSLAALCRKIWDAFAPLASCRGSRRTCEKRGVGCSPHECSTGRDVAASRRGGKSRFWKLRRTLSTFGHIAMECRRKSCHWGVRMHENFSVCSAPGHVRASLSVVTVDSKVGGEPGLVTLVIAVSVGLFIQNWDRGVEVLNVALEFVGLGEREAGEASPPSSRGESLACGNSRCYSFDVLASDWHVPFVCDEHRIFEENSGRCGTRMPSAALLWVS